jgi:hypothetical protein
MKTDCDPFSEENLTKVRAKQRTGSNTHRDAETLRKNGQKPPTRKGSTRKAPEIDFLTVRLSLWHKLINIRAGCSEWAMVGALCEAWFRGGVPGKHPNPFPLSAVDTKNWELTRSQKSRALQFLNRTQLITIDPADPENPLVTQNWVELFRLRA